jgi:hypothetical protein
MHRVAVTDHVGRALAHGPGENRVDLDGQRHVRFGQVTVDPGSGEGCLRALERVGEGQPPVALDGLTHFGEGGSRDGLDVVELGRGLRGLPLDELPRELALEGDHGQAVAEQVVKVARDPQALVRHSDASKLLTGCAQLAVRPGDPAECGHQHADRGDRQHGGGNRTGAVTVQPTGDADSERSHERHDDAGARRQAHSGGRDEVDEQRRERRRGARGEQDDRDHRQQPQSDQRRLRTHPRKPGCARQQ